MAVTLVDSVKYTPTSSLTTRNVTLPAGIQSGDVLFCQVVSASGAQTVTLSGVTGWTQLHDQVYSGHRQYLFWKIAESGDAGATLTVGSSSALRITAQVAVFRGAPGSAIIDVSSGVSGAGGGSTSIISPSVTTTATATMEIQFVGASGAAGVTNFTVPVGLTEIIDSYDAGTGGGHTNAIVAWNTVQQSAGATPGGDTWSINSISGVLLSALTVALKVAVAASSVRPSSTVASTGYTNVGGAASIHAALADESDSTYAETSDNPSGLILTVAHPELTTGPVTVKARLAVSASSPAVSVGVALLQNTTVIASWTVTPTTTPTDYEWTTTSGQTGNITDRTLLRTRITAG